MAETRLVSELHQHSLNQEIYEKFDPESQVFQELQASVCLHGILQPLIVRPSGVLLSGHRRLAVAVALGLERVPVEVREDGDDAELIVEFNRYRRKTISEMMREAELLQRVLKERAIANSARAGFARDESPPIESVNVRDAVAKALGMGSRSYHKLREVWNAAKESPNAKEALDKLDRGEMSIDAAHKSVKALSADTCEEDGTPDFLKYFNVWNFMEPDPRFGIPHPGRIPGQIAGNIIYYFTEPGDLVVDPMAGGGSTLDVAEFLGRKALGYDLAPRRPDIIQRDISDGYPEEAKDCQLIFMDPPYWNMIDEKYVEGSSSRLDLEEFKSWLMTLLFDSAACVRVGGFVALVIMNQYFRLPSMFKAGYIDWPFEVYELMLAAGLTPWTRISCPLTTASFSAFDVENCKTGRFMQPILRDVVVMRRM
jgi:ParB family transcriptional regulator, chromosome partitioning protein